MQLVWIGIWSWFGGDWSGFKINKSKKWQKEVENYVFPFRMITQNFCTVMRNGSKGNFSCNSKGNLKADFAWPCENFAQSCEMLQEGEIGADAFFTSHNHAKLLKLVRNCWILCKIAFFQISWWRSLRKTS